jgi:hypothetical protein
MYMKCCASSYLISCLEHPLKVILKEERDLEIDPNKFRNQVDSSELDERIDTIEGNSTKSKI